MRWLIGAWLFCLMGYILTGCSSPPEKEVYYGRTYKVVKGFYKNCYGDVSSLVGDDVLFNPLKCDTSETIQSRIYPVWVNKELLEEK